MEKFKDFLRECFCFAPAEWLDFCVSAALMLLVFAAAFALARVLRAVLSRRAGRYLERKNPRVASAVKRHRLVERLSGFLPALLILLMLPFAFYSGEAGAKAVEKICYAWIVALGVGFFNSALSALDDVASQKKRSGGGNYVKGFVQIFQVAAFFVAAIAIISILLGKSPVALLAGLGASAAVLMLIFKDTILGFVAGIQLSANDMLKVGDWITVKKHNADGVVSEVSLTAVKVRNFDNTTVTIPPYALVSDSFQNWRTMSASGGRRIMRSIFIDQQSVKFCEASDFESLSANPRTAEFFASAKSRKNLPSTNLGLFREYALFVIENSPESKLDFTYMARELAPTSAGLPLQFYFFANTVEWVAYENIQSDFIDKMIASAPLFGLRVFQEESDAAL